MELYQAIEALKILIPKLNNDLDNHHVHDALNTICDMEAIIAKYYQIRYRKKLISPMTPKMMNQIIEGV